MKRLATAVLALTLPASVSLDRIVHADEPQKKAPPAQAARQAPPSTPEEHLAAARGYRDQAESERRVAERHRFMIQRRKEEPGQVAPSDWYYKHCEKLIGAADDLARTATELAEYHEKTARELRSKAAR